MTVKAPVARVFRELLLWGEASWWPEQSKMRYTRLSSPGDVQVGTRYRQKVHVRFGPVWDAEITSIGANREVSFKFLNGMFKGVYRLYVIPEGGLCEVHFLMDYEVVGLVNRVAWRLMFERKHDENINMLLSAMKSYLEGSQAAVEETGQPGTVLEAERRKFLQGLIKR